MLAAFADILEEADGRGSAVGAFTAYNLEQALAIVGAAEVRGRGAIMLISEQTFRSHSGPAILEAFLAVASRTAADCCIQLDHVSDLDLMESALEAGVGALMADGSKLSYEDNVGLVARATRLAKSYGAGVEAELGHVAGDEELATEVEQASLTDPEEARELMESSGADCLAVSIGNVHGRYRRSPELDWSRLDAVNQSVPRPLSLHGASGIPDSEITRAVQAGIRKINVNTELRDRWFDVVGARSKSFRSGARLLALNEALVQGVQELVVEKLDLFSGKSASG